MDIVHCAEMPWGESLVAQRGKTDGMAHKRIFEGEEESPDNYMLVMSREPNSYFSPRHRHPWDQLRYCLEGKIPISEGLFVEGGEIAYFPESAIIVRKRTVRTALSSCCNSAERAAKGSSARTG